MLTDRRPIYVIAGSLAQAEAWANQNRLPLEAWRYVMSGTLRGQHIHPSQVVRVGTWSRHPEIREIEAALALATIQDDPVEKARRATSPMVDWGSITAPGGWCAPVDSISLDALQRSEPPHEVDSDDVWEEVGYTTDGVVESKHGLRFTPPGTPPRDIHAAPPRSDIDAAITSSGVLWSGDHSNHLHLDMGSINPGTVGNVTPALYRARFRDWDGQVRDDHGEVIGHLESLTVKTDGTTTGTVVFTDEDFLSQVRTSG